MCELYGVTRSGYYAWRNRGTSKRDREDRQLLAAIREVYEESHETYGSPRVFQVLKRNGWKVGRKRVERIMRENGLKARAQKIYKRCPEVQQHFVRVPNSLVGKQEEGPNEVWVGDITYLKANQKWHYLSVVMDRWSRKVISWSLGKEKSSNLTLKTLQKAVSQTKPKQGLLFHTDRGSEYLSHAFQSKAEELGITTSSNRPRHMNDNAYMESFFHSLKSDCYHGNKFTNEDELREMLESYIPFYNKKRLHSGLKYHSPVEYESLNNTS